MKNLLILLSVIFFLSCSSHSGRRVPKETKNQHLINLKSIDNFTKVIISIDTVFNIITLQSIDTTTNSSYCRTYDIDNYIDLSLIELSKERLLDEYIIMTTKSNKYN
jgi:hypothetical protein